MKLRNIFTILAAALAFAFVGCQEEERFLSEVKVSSSYVALPAEGGSKTIEVKAVGEWNFTGVPEWLTVSPASGSGDATVTFTAGATKSTNEASLSLNCAGAVQTINVLQMTEKVETPISTCKFVNEQGVDGTVYRVKGTVTSIANTQYGNWYLQDETGTVYVYGTLYDGAEKQFTKHGIEVGDIVTCEGPRKDYSGTIELVNVTVIAIEKSLIKVDEVSPEDSTLPVEGGEFTVTLTAKGDGVNVVVPEAAQSWLSVTGVSTSGSTTVVTFTAAANAGGNRETELTFKTTSNGVEYTAVAALKQTGSIVECSVADFLAQPTGTALFKLTGKVEKLQTGDYGNFNLVDATGSVYVYGLTATPVAKNDKSFPTLGIKEGDVVTLIGTRAEYNGTAQVGGPAYYVSHIGHKAATVAEFIAAAEDDTRYMLTGIVSNIAMDKNDPTKVSAYGNFDLTDETGTVYVYGLTIAPAAKNDKTFEKIGIKNGDKVTLIGTRTSYNGTVQVGGPAYYISHETPAEGGEEEGGNDTPATPASGKYVKVTSAPSDWTGKYLIVWGNNAHASLLEGKKDLNSTVAVTIADGAIEASADVNAAALTVTKKGDKYNMAFADGKYFGMQHNGCLLCNEGFDLSFEYTADGVKISGVPAGKEANYFLYSNSNNGNYYRCYVDKTGQEGYTLPTLYKLAE